MKIQGNMHISNSAIIKSNVEKQSDASHNIVSEDDMTISESAKKLAMAARNKAMDFRAMHFSSISGEIKEIPAEYRCENLFKLELKATSISGERSVFEGHSERQAEVFKQWIDENATEYLSEDEVEDLKEHVSAMITGVDELNAQEGYRGWFCRQRIIL